MRATVLLLGLLAAVAAAADAVEAASEPVADAAPEAPAEPRGTAVLRAMRELAGDRPSHDGKTATLLFADGAPVEERLPGFAVAASRGRALAEESPSLFVVSLAQLAAEFEGAEDARLRLRALRDELRALPKAAKVHVELSALPQAPVMQLLLESVLTRATSLGCDAQQLGALHGFLRSKGASVAALSEHEADPSVASTVDLATFVFMKLRGLSKGSVKRLHVYTPSQQLVLSHQDADQHVAQAAAHAALTTADYACSSSSPAEMTVALDQEFMSSNESRGKLRQLPDDSPVACWVDDARDVEFCVAPQLQCAQPAPADAGAHAGLAGLMYHV